HFERISTAQVDSLFDKLLWRQPVPFASIDAGVCAICTVERTCEARCIHRPPPAALALVRIKISDVVRLRRHIDEWSERAFRRHDQLPVTFEPDSCNKIRRRTCAQMLNELQKGIFSLSTYDVVDVWALECLFGKQ